ncbi:hypothetical protein OWM54_42615 [Myxococcus sp. MISCRS1]|uniref:hypothetical protein n=1 Tax=Myxococcus sp. MISCRS1 TaxID=2996786 RepID=UPI002270A6D8|nr:hypothetical protein [Myxococcus sp. MISCRS1]MCY1003859.1 hypothetical protein [Myxococcus sp. MISCRS1]
MATVLPRQESRTQAQKIAAISVFYKRGIFTESLSPAPGLSQQLVPTATGRQALLALAENQADSSDDERALALLIMLFHDELLVDPDKTDVSAIEAMLHNHLLAGNLKLPWASGRILHDRFFELFPNHTGELSHDQTLQLLQKTPTGVFQIGTLLIGPLGVLESAQYRYAPPVGTVPVRYCSDPSCESLHPIEISDADGRIVRLLGSLDDIRAEIFKEAERDWLALLIDHSPDYHDDLSLEDLPWFLGSAFSENELRQILKELLTCKAGVLRPRLPKDKRLRRASDGSAEQVSSRLKIDEILQLIMLAPNADIVECAESLIARRIILIPETEVRSSPTQRTLWNWLDVACECSQLGIRVSPKYQQIEMARLRRIIDDVFCDQRDAEELAWKLRHVSGESARSKLDAYVHSTEPKQVVSSLLLAGPVYLRRTFDALRISPFQMPQNRQEEDRLVDKILWKLGFNIHNFPSYQRLFWERLERLLETTRQESDYAERDREVIRSAAVNFFVSLEEVLDYSLSFSTWLLLQDHYAISRFQCSFDGAREFMAKRLSGRRKTTDGAIEFESSGKNTLYPLIQGFSILADLCAELLGAQEQWRRPATEMPSYHDKQRLFQLPFRYKIELLNLSENDRESLIQDLRETTQKLDAANVSSVRNRLEHKRVDFPSRDEIESACKAISDVLARLESTGLMPTVYFFAGIRVDSFGRGVAIMQDYRGRKLEAFHPSAFQFSGIPSLTEGGALLVVPRAHISGSAEYLRFRFKEKSDFASIWHDYPRRRFSVPLFIEHSPATKEGP